ncbi:hypothetical protein COV93_05985 [Candidatus Woesearchaeota archaeon CG11_big_fil_rev_8_21_14_0_20_43_8]|nr:MAG: hypothetical protein COV93_05985 [Candidatus Woesearchaeota archaeon CG11_big_fil_rev_8_21_14_0_20_43_8]PIO08860.1 MAG: hypothetical protein COT47_00870 [Candidatus Woesearchaeota archaeon CG08_land_8_20_14_0_20_43_7]
MAGKITGMTNRKEFAESIDRLNDSIASVGKTIRSKPGDPDFYPSDAKTSLQALKERIDTICSKPPISIAKIDEMFLEEQEKERIKRMSMREMEDEVAESVADKTVRKIEETNRVMEENTSLPELPNEIKWPTNVPKVDVPLVPAPFPHDELNAAFSQDHRPAPMQAPLSAPVGDTLDVPSPHYMHNHSSDEVSAPPSLSLDVPEPPSADFDTRPVSGIPTVSGPNVPIAPSLTPSAPPTQSDDKKKDMYALLEELKKDLGK